MSRYEHMGPSESHRGKSRDLLELPVDFLLKALRVKFHGVGSSLAAIPHLDAKIVAIGDDSAGWSG